MVNRSAEVMLSGIPTPDAIPRLYREFNQYLIFDMNFPFLVLAGYVAYYFALEPVAAVRSFSPVLYSPHANRVRCSYCTSHLLR